MSVCLVIMFWAGRHGPECACHQKQTNIFARSAVIFRAGNTNSRRSPCFAAFHSNPVTRAASSWFGGLVISLSLCGRRWKTCTKVCAGKERYSNLPDDINEAVGNQIYGVVDSNSDADLYHKVLSFISVNGVGESWEIRQSANPTGGCLLVELDKMSVLSPTPCSSLHDTMQPEVRWNSLRSLVLDGTGVIGMVKRFAAFTLSRDSGRLPSSSKEAGPPRSMTFASFNRSMNTYFYATVQGAVGSSIRTSLLEQASFIHVYTS
eukprot:s2434_g5.t3